MWLLKLVTSLKFVNGCFCPGSDSDAHFPFTALSAESHRPSRYVDLKNGFDKIDLSVSQTANPVLNNIRRLLIA